MSAEMDFTKAEIPNSPNKLVNFTYGTGDDKVQVPVPRWVLELFRIFCDINADLPLDDGTFYANIPILKDAYMNPIYFNAAELTLFFELSAIEPLTIQHLEDSCITTELSTRFIMLVNFLDYAPYVDILCEYAGKLIYLDNFPTN